VAYDAAVRLCSSHLRYLLEHGSGRDDSSDGWCQAYRTVNTKIISTSCCICQGLINHRTYLQVRSHTTDPRGRTPIGAAVDVQPTTLSHRRRQPAPPILSAGASPGSTVLPEMVRPAPLAWVISTLRGWLRGDAGRVTCRTPSA
jgi:hypothetical protein